MEKRKEATTGFEKDFRKLLTNCVFGKSCESPRNYIKVVFVQSHKEFQREVRKNTFKRYVAFGEKTGLVIHDLPTLNCDKLVYIGATVLQLSKLHMFKFHYETMIPFAEKKGATIETVYTDTDSEIFKILSWKKVLSPSMNKWI